MSRESMARNGRQRARRYRARRANRIILVQVELRDEFLKGIALRSGRPLEYILKDRERLARVVAWLAQRGLAATKEKQGMNAGSP